MTQPWDQPDEQGYWQRPAAGRDLPEPTLEMPTEQLHLTDDMADGWARQGRAGAPGAEQEPTRVLGERSGASAAELPTFSPYDDPQQADATAPSVYWGDAQDPSAPQADDGRHGGVRYEGNQYDGEQAGGVQRPGPTVAPQYPSSPRQTASRSRGAAPSGAQQPAPQYGQYPDQYAGQQYPGQQFVGGQYPAQQYPSQPWPAPGVAPSGSPLAHSVPVGPVPGWPVLPNPQAPFGYEPTTGLPYSDKSKVTAGLLQLLLGGFGAGRFYKGDIGMAIAQVVVVLLTLGVGVVWPFIDGIVMLCGRPTDRYGRPLHG